MTLDECKEHARRRGWGGTRNMPQIVDPSRNLDERQQDFLSPDKDA